MGGEENAAVLRQHGSPPEFAFTVRDHLWLGERLDLLDFETAAIVSGRKFVYLRRAAALLEMALCRQEIHFFLTGSLLYTRPERGWIWWV